MTCFTQTIGGRKTGEAATNDDDVEFARSVDYVTLGL
jgi:hypothetical protein